jgi:hypothetical protein
VNSLARWLGFKTLLGLASRKARTCILPTGGEGVVLETLSPITSGGGV